MYQITLRKPESDGYYRRNLGKLPNGLQPKFSVGRRKPEAMGRLQRIAAIWQRIASRAERDGEPAYWDDLGLAVARAIAKGKPAFHHDPHAPDAAAYAHAVDTVAALYPEIRVLPKNAKRYSEGKGTLQGLQTTLDGIDQQRHAIARQCQRVASTILAESGEPLLRRGDLLADSLHDALSKYAEHIAADCFDITEGAISDTGKTRCNYVKQLQTYLPNAPLATLDTYNAVDALFAILRARPVTLRYGKTMSRKNAKHLLCELRRAFDWIHFAPEFDWTKPADFASLKTTPKYYEADVEHETKTVPIWTVEQLQLLWRVATPREKCLLALGLNCAFGADQIGRLRIPEIVERNGKSYIRRVRRKQKVEGRHLLWTPTLLQLQNAIGNRKSGFVLLTQHGNPYWRKTLGGNRCQAIPNAWRKLLARARQEHPDLPPLGFNSLRDTSASLMRRIAGAEIASIHLTHRHTSPDKSLAAYANVPWRRVFAAQRRLGEKLTPVFAAETPPKRSRKPAKTPQTAP